MKKLFLLAFAAAALTAQAQQALEAPSFGDNWSVGIEGGGITPLYNGSSFIGDMRGGFGLNVRKQISPVFGLGVEGAAYINTSYGQSKTAIDNSYVGAFGTINLFNLFGGYKCDGRFFDMEIQAGAGWLHSYVNGDGDENAFGTKAGLNFNFNLNRNFTLSLKPAVIWNMSDAGVSQSSAAYNKETSAFQIFVGATYKFGEGFKCADLKNQAEIDALNAQINALRGELDACVAANAAALASAAALQAELDACKNRAPQVIEKVNDNLQSVRYVFYKVGSSVITADQKPNVEMIASYLKNHKDSKVVVKGYASPDGNREFNIKLAAARAESVKTMLIKKYGIAADRIQAEGCGIGDMFSENDWNRVSICTLED
ncbi:MAG: OmpA family protein [Muribaculaceae bacterium]|nr:OmpA family protein [Muribaculaceae bacterium]